MPWAGARVNTLRARILRRRMRHRGRILVGERNVSRGQHDREGEPS